MKASEKRRISRDFVQQYIDRIYQLETVLGIRHHKVDIRGKLGDVLCRLRDYMYNLENQVRERIAQRQ